LKPKYDLSLNQQINRTLLKFWELEQIDRELLLNPEKTLCMEQFATSTRKEDKRFIAKATNQGGEIATTW